MKLSASFNQMILRREMLRRCLRCGGLVGLTGVASWLAARSLRADCAKAGPCGNCPQFSGCELPKAKAQKPVVKPPSGHV